MQKKSLIYFADYRVMLNNKNKLVIHAGSNPEFFKDAKITASIDGKETKVDAIWFENERTRFCYKTIDVKFSAEMQLVMYVPDEFDKVELKVAFSDEYDNQEELFVLTSAQYKKITKLVNVHVDVVNRTKEYVQLVGWYSPSKHSLIEVFDGNKRMKCRVDKYPRNDIANYYQPEERRYAVGFSIIMDYPVPDSVKIVFKIEDRTIVRKEDIRVNRDVEKLSFSAKVTKSIEVLKRKGAKHFVNKVINKISGKTAYDYTMWIKDKEPDKKVLAAQRIRQFEYRPKFSIVVPVYRPDKEFFRQMIQSVMEQTYDNFELCLADGGGEGHYVEDVVKKFARHSDKIKYKKLDKNLGIADNTNAAIELSSGDYIVLGDHDDLFRPNALYECVRAINKERDIDVIYTDEDKFDTEKKVRFSPYFKSDYNPDLLRSNNYICHMFVFSRAILEKVGGFRQEFDGAQDYDMILRCTESANNIKHIHKVLYSWRCHADSTALNPRSKMYAFEAGRKAIQAHLDRLGIDGTTEMTEDLGFYRVKYHMNGNPKVSIIIPNKDHTDDLDICIKSIYEQDYPNFEVIVVENNSTSEKTFKYYEEIQKKYDSTKVVFWTGKGFNYSAINNFGVEQSTGEYLLLLNNDTQMINPDCIETLLSHFAKKNVGIVGAKLYYPDNTIQHAGVVMGYGGVAGHAFYQYGKDYKGYFSRAVLIQNYSVVTGACLMTKKDIYNEVKGLEEDLAVAYNDVDYCLKVRDKGYLVVFEPYAELYHYESKSRGGEDETEEKKIRFKKEQNYIIDKWSKYIDKGDPYYNVNLTLTRSDFALKE